MPFHGVNPVAVQLEASVLLQLTVDDAPYAIEAGLALKVTVGNAGAATVRVAVLVVVPPIPVQASDSVPPAVRVLSVRLPLIALAPVQAE